MKAYVYFSLALLFFSTPLWSQSLSDCKKTCTVERVVYKDAQMGVELYNKCASLQADGAIIKKVIKGSVAEKMGFEEGDIITHINNIRVIDNRSLIKEIKQHEPFDTVTIVYRRIAKTSEIVLVLDARSQEVLKEEICCDTTYSVDVFPNPVSNKLNVSIADNKKELQFNFKIYSLQGLLIQDITEKKERFSFEKQLSVEDLPDGIYMLEVSTKNATTIKKFIVKH